MLPYQGDGELAQDAVLRDWQSSFQIYPALPGWSFLLDLKHITFVTQLIFFFFTDQ
jgi:hypothetical protein